MLIAVSLFHSLGLVGSDPTAIMAAVGNPEASPRHTHNLLARAYHPTR